jgi:5'-3' exonuclease
MVLRIDGDILVYRVGFGYKDADLLDTVDGMDKAITEIKEAFPGYEHELVISNSAKTFRHDIAVTQPYKGNRTAPKPTYYHELRDYMANELGATVSPAGYEADDYIGMNTDKKNDIITTIDKDLHMIPAKGHYNFVKKEMTKVKRPLFFFWKQVLTGDRADNILGLHLIGEKRANDILADLKVKDMKKVVEEQYQKQFGENWFQRFDENCRLLWIKRDYNKEYYDYV